MALSGAVTEARLAEEVRRLEALIAAERDERRWQEEATKALLEALHADRRSDSKDTPVRHEFMPDGTPRRRKWYKAGNQTDFAASVDEEGTCSSQRDRSFPLAVEKSAQPQNDNWAVQQADKQQPESPQLVEDGKVHVESGNNLEGRKNAVTTKQLDLGDMYEPNTSIWDASMFVFHPCLGPMVSAILILVWLLNVAVQVFFCYIVFENMLEDDVRSETLTELLRFRVSTGHNVFYADSVSQRSLTAQVCMEDRKAFVAGLQMEKVDDVEEFLEGGTSLMIVAQGLWICTVLRELNAAWSFARALLHVHRGRNTRLILAESNDFDEHSDAHFEIDSDDEISSLATLMVVTRMTKIKRLRLWASMALIFVPRLLLALLLGYTGVRFLGKTARNEDLLLNAIALAFVSEIDELFFDIFVPRRAHALIRNLEALPMPHKKCQKSAGAHSIFKIALVSGALLATYYLLLRPYFWMLNQAYDIVCSGEQNFVYGENSVTGLVHVAKTKEEDDWTELEKIVLQVAHPTIEAQFSWDIDSEIVERSTANKTQAIFMTDHAFHANNISTVNYSAKNFWAVQKIDYWTVAEAAKAQSCTDLNAGDVALAALRYLMKDDNITSCQDVAWQYCSDLNMRQLRALCPQRCNCDRPPLISHGYAGFFRTPASGCPGQCASLTASYNEISYQMASSHQAFSPYSITSCNDVFPDNLIHYESQTCVHSDQFVIGITGPASNSDAQNCEAYWYAGLYFDDVTLSWWQHAFSYVDTDGRHIYSQYSCPSQFDDSDFTANDMCCRCGGGYRGLNHSSASCLDNLTDECNIMSPTAFWFLLYVKGLFATLHSNQFFLDTLRDSVNNPSQLIGTEFYQSEDLVQSVMNGSLAESLVNGKWEFMPDHAHPRKLTGCEFLTSFEFKALLNLDLCDSDDHGSIKFICPESCGCRPTMVTNEGRNFMNIEDVTSTDVIPAPDYAKYPSYFMFSNDRVRMSECPASCAVPHRLFGYQAGGWGDFEEMRKPGPDAPE